MTFRTVAPAFESRVIMSSSASFVPVSVSRVNSSLCDREKRRNGQEKKNALAEQTYHTHIHTSAHEYRTNMTEHGISAKKKEES